ncbi:MAG: glucosaminidase domain-containing protein [Bacteroidaceae bacterium]|nr:glucosaminidase domain-containing protein [Bacteroidaceae bacterium]
MRHRFALFSLVLLLSLAAGAQNAQYVKYVRQYKDLAIEQMKKYNIPASITLAQALLESGAGQSELARESNNHFGIKCHNWSGKKVYHDDDASDDCFRVYKSVRDSYEDHSIFLSTSQRYRPLFKLKNTDYVGWAQGLKLAGYATNPSYADRLINIIESYNLDQYDVPYGTYTVLSVGSHQPHLANGLVYVVTRKGDTIKLISDEFGISVGSLLRYNDLYKGYVPEDGDILYLHRKNWRAKKPYKTHVVREGESMYSISQMYGIRLARLYRMNRDKGDITSYAPSVGDVIRLR